MGISRKHPFAARILRRWRGLTGGKGVRDTDRLTVVASSGGADSVALGCVLSAVEPKPVIAHVVHDIRDEQLAMRDRDAVKALAEKLGCAFHERRVSVKEQAGNLEANARSARYGALCEIASEVGAGVIVTGHHADDQLETVLMRMMRGTGVRGIGGVSPSLEMGSRLIVRPMLEITREEIEGYCKEIGVGWVHDHTNDDEGYLRNRIRHSVLPILREIEPEVAGRVSKLARSCRDTNKVIERMVRDGVVTSARKERIDKGEVWSWDRNELRDQPEAVLAELVFVYIGDALGGAGADSINREGIEMMVRGIKSGETDPRVYRVGPMVVHVQARSVVISMAGSSASCEAGQERSSDE